jgi:NitT/TauT family transport system substrate-binding protein
MAGGVRKGGSGCALRQLAAALLLGLLPSFGAAVLPGGATALAGTMPVRVANAAPTSFFFLPLDAGIAAGIYAGHGLQIEPMTIFGGGKGAQALAAGSVDIELGGGPELASIAKGAPTLGIADPVAIPGLMALVVPPDGAASLADLKGKTLAVSTRGSLTDWLAHEVARRQGWGPDGVRVVAVGAGPSMVAALKTHQVDATIQDLPAAYKLEQGHDGRILVRMQELIPDFILHTIFANRRFLDEHPDAARAFLAAWFDSVAHMRAHRDETVAVAATSLGLPPDIAARAYDELMPMFSQDGHFPKSGLQLLADSFVQMGTLPTPPDMSKLVTEAYLPAR